MFFENINWKKVYFSVISEKFNAGLTKLSRKRLKRNSKKSYLDHQMGLNNFYSTCSQFGQTNVFKFPLNYGRLTKKCVKDI